MNSTNFIKLLCSETIKLFIYILLCLLEVESFYEILWTIKIYLSILFDKEIRQQIFNSTAYLFLFHSFKENY